jgi:hypothetical protein
MDRRVPDERPPGQGPRATGPDDRIQNTRTTPAGAEAASRGDPMRIYEGSPRQDFEEVFRSIGAFLDQRRMTEVLLVEAPDGFIVQGIVIAGGSGGSWSESMGSQT